MMSRSSAVILSLSLMCSLASSAFAGCGSSKPKAEQKLAAAEQPVKAEAPSGARSFCERLSRVYCTNDYDSDPTQIIQTTFEEMSKEEQESYFVGCEEAWEKADEKQRDIMGHCAGCVADCSFADQCLYATSTGCPEFEEEEPSSEE